MLSKSWKTSIALLLTPLVGCSAAVPLQYEFPPPALKQAGPVIRVQAAVENRASREIDESLTEPSLTSLDRAVVAAVAASGCASRVIPPTDVAEPEGTEPNGDGPVYMVAPTLDVLKWDVPGYDDMVVTSFFVSLVFGLVGGMIYLSTSAEVHGEGDLTVRMTNLATGAEIVRRYYVDNERTMVKAECDTPETKSKVVGATLQELMDKFSADLAAFVGPASPTPAVAGP